MAQSDTFSRDTYSASSRDVTCTAYPVTSVPVFLGVPLQTSDGQALCGVPNVGPIPTSGTVRVNETQDSSHLDLGEQHHSGLRDWDRLARN
ncbi:MAG: hypothetical protein ACYCW6_03875 [Candidatus Xenobia bacterium]